ncbi:AraC-like DNA-binding protein [Orbus hercynius]|uniref:AraC-like DNA-binding protein n=1 Tax=Orbus hercynius TaxID=593135 RepID=A0A495RK40_9GAMM|nr:AraC family transcriptional regulator [Orbus hercynius]RKS87526.1 AraC-like DNA-binding protein [Orbus hercynius]
MIIPLQPELYAINHQLKQLMLIYLTKTTDYTTPIDNLSLFRRDEAQPCSSCFYQPMVSIIVQGSKLSLIGSKQYSYQAGDCLLTAVDVPAINTMTDVSPQSPFLSLALYLDKDIINQLISDFPQLSLIPPQPFEGMLVTKVELGILSAFVRLIQLLATPEHIAALAPLIIKEIHYLLLIGPFGQQLRSINTAGTQSHHIAKTINWLKVHYKQPIVVEELAQQANMALSTFHRHFKYVTTLTPLQYQKKLRLYEARRLMLSENNTANQAGLAVGYESITQFNREYKRLFNAPPHSDIMRVRQVVNR